MIRQRTAQKLSVQATSYPVPPNKAFLVSLVFYIQLMVVTLIIVSDTISPRYGFRGLDGKLYPILLTWFIGNIISGGLTQTGAFEIWKGNTLIWSKLVAGRNPTIDDLVSALSTVGVQLKL